MSNFTGFSRRAAQQSSVPHGDVLGTYSDYLEAQNVINVLAKAEFDVKNMAIVGRDLTTVEVVTARLSYGRGAIAGATTGAWLGLFLGLIATIITPISTQQIGIFFAAILTGAGIGMIFGVVNYSMVRKRRDFASAQQLIAERYDIIISPELTAKAHRVLGTNTAGVHDAPAVPDNSQSSTTGERAPGSSESDSTPQG